MRIRTQLRALSCLSVLLVGAVLGSLVWAAIQIDSTRQRAAFVEKVLPLVLDLEVRLRSRGQDVAGAAADWESSHQALQALLRQAPALPGQQQILLNSVRQHTAGLGVLFDHLMKLREADALLTAHLRERLQVQVETVREDAVLLATDVREALRNTLIRQLMAVAVFMVAVVLAFLIIVLRIARGVGVAIPELQAAVAAVSDGRLDTEVREPGLEELADIARHFNHMTRKLRDTMVRRDHLQAIVDERTAALRELADSDPLTGVANRRRLFERGAQEFARARRHDGELGLVMIDCDDFKQINDSYGHDVGDLCLRHLMQLCRQEIRDEDLLARFGGEEFVLLLPASDLEGAFQLAERVRLRVRQAPLDIAGEQVAMTISSGVAALTKDTENFGQLLSRADRALLRAKANGRDRSESAIAS